MPDIEVCDLNQDAVLWEITGTDAHGAPILGPAIPLNARDGCGVRWKYQRSEMMDPQRATITVDATVVVTREISVDALLWLGKLRTIDDPDVGPLDETVNGVHQVKAYTNTPSLNARSTRRTLGVVRYRGTLPEGFG